MLFNYNDGAGRVLWDVDFADEVRAKGACGICPQTAGKKFLAINPDLAAPIEALPAIREVYAQRIKFLAVKPPKGAGRGAGADYSYMWVCDHHFDRILVGMAKLGLVPHTPRMGRAGTLAGLSNGVRFDGSRRDNIVPIKADSFVPAGAAGPMLPETHAYLTARRAAPIAPPMSRVKNIDPKMPERYESESEVERAIEKDSVRAAQEKALDDLAKSRKIAERQAVKDEIRARQAHKAALALIRADGALRRATERAAKYA